MGQVGGKGEAGMELSGRRPSGRWIGLRGQAVAEAAARSYPPPESWIPTWVFSVLHQRLSRHTFR